MVKAVMHNKDSRFKRMINRMTFLRLKDTHQHCLPVKRYLLLTIIKIGESES